ncbi:MAG: TetR/AcrR family transcriptional regulator [Spirochaetia bacterium]|nr:TetR/AcrR family transcriptional regulator [Spirochaetia bacterium]
MASPRQIEILEAAIRLTSEAGIQNLTIRNVASAVGVSEPALYRHFASKHELLVAILQYLESKIAHNFIGFVQPTGSSSEQFRLFLENLFTELEQNRAFALLLFAEETFNADPALRPELNALLDKNLSILTAYFSHIMEEGRCRKDISAAQLALMTFGAIRLTVSRWHLKGEGEDLLSYAPLLHRTVVQLFTLN